MIKKLEGRAISSSLLQRLQRKTKTFWAQDTNLLTTQAERNQAYKTYCAAKAKAEMWRNSFLEQLALRRSQRFRTEYDTELKQLSNTELAWKNAGRICLM